MSGLQGVGIKVIELVQLMENSIQHLPADLEIQRHFRGCASGAWAASAEPDVAAALSSLDVTKNPSRRKDFLLRPGRDSNP